MPSVAYLTAEIGLQSDLPTYSGGLGVLAGDHIKASADLGLDLVAVTLLYRHGYARQHLEGGTQTESFPAFDPSTLLEDTGLVLEDQLEGRPLRLRIWRYRYTGVTGHHVDVYFLDPETGTPLRHFYRQSICGSAIRVSPDGRYLAATGDDGIIRMWDLHASSAS